MTLDTFLFIPSYSGLLITIGLMLARGDEKWRAMLVLVALVGVPLAAACDWKENYGITAVLDKLERATPLVLSDATRISMPSMFKWAATALVLLIYGASAFRRLGVRNWPPALIAVAGVGLGAILIFTLTGY